jgi:uncharacterized protein
MAQRLRAVLRVVVLALLACAAPAAVRAGTPIPPAPAQWVTDTAGVLQPETVRTLNRRLRRYQRETGHQIVVYVAPTTGGTPIDDWAVSAFAQWKVGRQGHDDGLVLFIFTHDRTARIEVGYGLEPTVPDIVAGEILRETVEPELTAGHPDQAVTDGVDRILARIGGETPENDDGDQAGGGGNAVPLSPIDLVALGVLGIIFLLVVIRSPWLIVFLLSSMFGGGGGGGYGGGGFSGGGGRSGGGGASGRW